MLATILELDEPLEGVIITIDGQTGTTDAGGNFIVPNVVVGNGRVAFVDGRPVVKGTEKYPIVEAMLNVRVGIANRVPYIIWLPALSQHLTHIDPTQDTVVTNPDIPDMQVLIPKGTVLTTLEGTTVTDMSITQVPIDRAPMPLPEDWTVGSLFSIQPGGALANRPIPVIYPNILGNEPGTRVNLFFFDVEIGDWRVYGQGTVSQDGRRIIPDPGVGQPRTAWGGAAPPPPPPPPPPEDNSCKLRDPVDVSTGQFILEETDMTLPGRIPIRIVRSYRSGLGTIGNVSTSGIFGAGTTWNYGLALGPVGSQASGFTSGNGFYLFSQNPDGTQTNTAFPFLRGDRVTTASDGTRTMRKKDGTVYVFDANGRLTEQRDRNGNQLLYTRDSNGNVIKIADPSGRGLTLTYSGSRITSITDPIGRTVTYGYSSGGQLETVTNPAGGTTTYTYEGNNRISTITDPNGTVIVRNLYDPNGRVIQQEEIGGGVARYNYVLSGSLVAQTESTDPLGNVSIHRLNSRGYCTATIDALGNQTRYERDFSTNLLLSERDPLNRITRYTYDLAGNTTSVVDPAGNVTLMEYELTFNNLVRVTDALGQDTRFVYDERGNRVQTIDPVGHITTSVYDTQGQVVQTIDALGNTTSFGYDQDGNLVVVTDPVGNQTRRVYDARSRILEVTNGKGETTKFAYNPMNRVTTITDPTGAAVSLTYDANQNLLSVTDQKNQTLTHTYDLRNRLIALTDPLGLSETYEYDANDNEMRKTDRKGQATTTAYDPLNRKSLETFADGSTVTYRYDPVGHLIELVDSLSGTIAYTYHTVGACLGCGAGSLDQLVQETTAQGTVKYTYDAIQRRTGLAINTQTPIVYTYDPHNLLVNVEHGTQTIQLGYDAANRRTSLTYPNGVTTSYRYDAAGQVLEIAATLGLTPLETLSYAYDRSGNRTTSGRQLGATLLPAEVTAAVDAANRLFAFNGDQLSYDANGNLTARNTAMGTTSYTWDARNRLVAISGPGVVANFSYDALGRRVSKTINGQRTDYLYSDQSIVQEFDGGAASVTYLIGDRVDEVFARVTSTGPMYYQSDALGSAMALTDEQGAVSTTYAYEPFGRTVAAGEESANPFQYTGRENDQTGLYYYRARHYSPALQRFISEDPIRLSSGQLNLYVYVANNPVNAVDPSGLVGAGTQACEYYSQLCEKTGKCGKKDMYACNAYQCCKDFGEGLARNCVRRCLIEFDQDFCADRRSPGVKQACRIVAAHVLCYTECLAPHLLLDIPKSCGKVVSGG